MTEIPTWSVAARFQSQNPLHSSLVKLIGAFDSEGPLASERTYFALDDRNCHNDHRGKVRVTRRRWIADEVSDACAALVGAHAQHLAQVLRARVGQEFDIATGEDVRRGRITSIRDGRVEFELGEVVPAAAAPDLTIVVSILKFDRMEWAIEKCVELGVSRIVPVVAQRTEAHLAKAAQKRVERWQRIALQASEQSRRATAPEISAPQTLHGAVTAAGGTHIVLAESEWQMTLKDALQTPPAAGEITLAFGPEGGWSKSELKLFQGAGWTAASLGSTILRAETAVIAAVAITLAELQ
jgi:16S rRNA (uracil1498-N3)-methyltransferase